MKKVAFCFLMILLMQLSIFVAAAIPTAEREALIALYNSTDGDNWNNNSGWKTPPLHTDGFALPGTEGNWYGVYIPEYHVEKIYLGYNRLCNSIPPELGILGNLQELSLGGNQLGGSIPSELGNLSNLQELFLYENQLSGSIPSQLGNLSQLVELGLRENRLSGSIPPELGNLSNLKSLMIFDNQLSGSIPAELGNLSNLQFFRLDNNQLSGSIPSQLGKLSQLQYLWLQRNHLSGRIPAELGKLSQLQYLYLQNNQLSGSISPELGNLSQLRDLLLTNNRLSGSIPPEFGNLSNLHRLVLDSNQLSGSIPAELGNLSNLEEIDLSRNQLSGSIPSIFINLKSIWHFEICYNCLSASDPALRAWLNSHDPDWEAHQCGVTPGPPVIGLNRTTLNFGALDPGKVTGTQTVLIDNDGGGTLKWRAAGYLPWLSFSPTVGTGASILSVSVDPTGLVVGSYTGTITITDSNAFNSPQTVIVHLQVIDPNNDAPPIGDFSTPTDGSTVMGSIPVTGWALDDIEIEEVKLYAGSSYMGNAVFVPDARPDVETSYPGYPQNDRASWGYMMLTNFLPDGEVVLMAIAKDTLGKETVLGTKTITIANANAVKPFGAIDTPAQDGTASGKNFINWGWVLTPMPNLIPTDGSSINVWVDGIAIGHPTYNLYREDIAAIFPGYANSSNAAGYFILDTNFYKNGLHTISWTAADNAGNQEGIGSRFFEICNTGQSAAASGPIKVQAHIPREELARIPLDYSSPITVEKGFAGDSIPQTVYPDDNGVTSIAIRELERVEIQLGENNAHIQGCSIGSKGLNKLPIGSTLDTKSGTFSWIPGPGFIGNYSLVFILTDANGQSYKKSVEIKIEPKFNGK